ncbi:TVP38/TMEM64 family protein [Legionella septentrionalis]|uniref:TVP38/TMEM64 family protein n=1 Tax=Legionella septentrionalis TaxID=2498109 RepID=UPI001F3FB3CE|nr:TVP38/TMEM64 family protein [Legionella septentrionalis]
MNGRYLALAIVVITGCAIIFQQNVSLLIEWITKLGWIAPILFLVLYCFATIFFLPTMMLTLAGGAIFGPFLGIIYNLLGATLGAACAFCISRHLVSDKLIGINQKRINKFILGVEERGWQFVAILRLLPVVPFSLVNYGLGLTRIKFTQYMWATVIFLIPLEIIYTYCGHLGMTLMTHSSSIYRYSGLLGIGIILLLLGVYQMYKKITLGKGK